MGLSRRRKVVFAHFFNRDTEKIPPHFSVFGPRSGEKRVGSRKNGMLVYVHGAKCVGIEAVPVTVEVNVTLGIGIHIWLSKFLILF